MYDSYIDNAAENEMTKDKNNEFFNMCMTAMFEKAKKLNVSELKEQAIAMFNSEEDYACEVLNSLLGALETMIPESEFVEFFEAM